MSQLPVLTFVPVPLRQRCDGWSPELQLRFIEALAAGVRPGEAARRLGKNRQNAYALRRRSGAESFAAAWDAAVAWGRRTRIEAAPSGARFTSMSAPLPAGPEAEAIIERAYQEIDRTAARSPETARRALGEMLDALYGPKGGNGDNSDNSDNKDRLDAGDFTPGGPHFPLDSRRSVAFRDGAVKRPSC